MNTPHSIPVRLDVEARGWEDAIARAGDLLVEHGIAAAPVEAAAHRAEANAGGGTASSHVDDSAAGRAVRARAADGSGNQAKIAPPKGAPRPPAAI